MLVIALVVWLIVVFFSVTDGLEKNWVNKLTALTAPVRITPTDAYYNSYYYLIDGISDRSNYGHKTIREKKEALSADPYLPESDEELPASWPAPDRNADHSLKDLVKLVYSSLDEIQGVPDLYGEDFELTGTHIQLDLIRRTTVLNANNIYGGTQQSTLSYPAYLGNFEPGNQSLKNTLLPIQMSDLNNLLNLIGVARSDSTDSKDAPASKVHEKLKSFTMAVLKKPCVGLIEGSE